ncbi:MAG TPA: S41 family peptidase [Gaiellales bacterium]|nr:S41 family peptidase [Gaiellales bacterium]
MGRRGLIWLLAFVSLLVAFFGGFELRSRPVEGPGAAQAATIRRQVLQALQQSYYVPLSQAALHAHDVRGMLHALHDPYTRYLSPHAYQLVVREEQSRYVGVGLAFERGRDGLKVTATLPGMPAAGAGIRAGDTITQIGSVPLRKIRYARAGDMLHGPVGSHVTLVVRDEGATRRVTLDRAVVDLPKVYTRNIRYNGRAYTYLRLPGIVRGVGSRVRAVAEETSSKHRAGLILDLRGDGGGLLDEAVNVADVFQDSGVVVAIHGLHLPKRIYSADNQAVANLPLVVLVDGNTASAAEVVAGSLQRAHRAIVVGTRSFGKGTVQALRPLTGGGALKLTVATFSLAGGERVNRRGIRPDVRAVNRPGTRADEVLRAALRVLAKA